MCPSLLIGGRWLHIHPSVSLCFHRPRDVPLHRNTVISSVQPSPCAGRFVRVCLEEEPSEAELLDEKVREFLFRYWQVNLLSSVYTFNILECSLAVFSPSTTLTLSFCLLDNMETVALFSVSFVCDNEQLQFSEASCICPSSSFLECGSLLTDLQDCFFWMRQVSIWCVWQIFSQFVQLYFSLHEFCILCHHICQHFLFSLLRFEAFLHFEIKKSLLSFTVTSVLFSHFYLTPK